jgi:hypothetical protein
MIMMKSTVITYPGQFPRHCSLQRDQGLARSWPLEFHAITPLLLVLQVSLSRLGLLASMGVPECLLGAEEAPPAICWSISETVVFLLQFFLLLLQGRS